MKKVICSNIGCNNEFIGNTGDVCITCETATIDRVNQYNNSGIESSVSVDDIRNATVIG